MNYKKKIHSDDQAGFTLLETSIAMVLLAIVGLGIASCFFFAAKNNSSARDRALAMAVAQQQMEQYRNLKFSDAGMAATNGATDLVLRGGRRYQVLTTITDSNVQNGTARTKTIQLRVVPWSDGSTWARNVSTVFGSVTVIAERTSQVLGPNRSF
jgi:prepilin-type N-terminal cleavage/methylation domain-containing protein